MELETRYLEDLSSETRDNGFIVRGVAIRYNSTAKVMLNGRMVNESFNPGVFKDTLESREQIYALHNHDWNRVLGSTLANTFEVEDSPEALRFKINMPKSYSALYEAIERRDVTGASVRFVVQKQGFSLEDGEIRRRVEGARLREVSITPNPAYADSEVATSVRSMEEWLQTNETRGILWVVETDLLISDYELNRS